MTPFPHLKQTSQEAGGTRGVKKFQRKLQMNFKEDFFPGHPVPFWEKSRLWSNGGCGGLSWNGRTLKLVLRAMLDSIAPQRCVQTLAGAEKNRL